MTTRLAITAPEQARRCRKALLRGRYERALRELRIGTRSLGERRGRAVEIRELWKAARALLRATRRIDGGEHLAHHGQDRPDRRTVEAAQFDVGTLLDIVEARLRLMPRARRWFRRGLTSLSGREDPREAWNRLVHLSVRLVRADSGALVEVRDGKLRIRASADPRGVPLPASSTPLPRGAVVSARIRQRERLPGWRLPEGGRVLVVPVPDGRSGSLVLVLRRRSPAPRYGEERRLTLRVFLRRAGPAAATVGRRRKARESEDRRRREERRMRQERSEARAHQRRYLKTLREARRDEASFRSSLRHRYDRIVGSGGRMARIFKDLDKVIPTDLPVLLLGETGTGKELVARAIHDYSGRRDGPFVSMNSAALPESLAEVELFGHRRGAYTDANRERPGRIREADRGTFFLDEIGEMSTAAQGKLLRVLETGLVRPVGGRREHRVDVRLIAATNQDLDALVGDGRFREDLYHRVNVVPITLPPLRERLEDLPLLVDHFLQAHGRGAVPAVTDDVMDRLRAHSWPGNIRELEMCLRVALVLCEGPWLLPEHLQIDAFVPAGTDESASVLEELLERQRRLLEEWPRDEPIRCSAYAARFGVPPRTASRDLAELAERGYLRRLGAGRGTRFLLSGGS